MFAQTWVTFGATFSAFYLDILAHTYEHGAAAEPGHAARRRNTARTTAYQHHHDRSSYQFELVSFETLGRFSPGAMQFLGTDSHGAFPDTS